MRTSPLFACVLAATAASGCYFGVDPGPGPSADGTITIENASSYVITEVRVTAVDNLDWGPNLLANVLYPREQLTVSVACDTYDVLVSDEYARDCVLGAVDLCFSDKLWLIDDATLRDCGF